RLTRIARSAGMVPPRSVAYSSFGSSGFTNRLKAWLRTFDPVPMASCHDANGACDFHTCPALNAFLYLTLGSFEVRPYTGVPVWPQEACTPSTKPGPNWALLEILVQEVCPFAWLEAF